MSEADVELVREVVTEFARTQRLPDRVSPDFVWDMGSWAAWTDRLTYEGRDAFMEFFDQWVEAYDEWQQDFEGFVDAGGGLVVSTTTQRGRLHESAGWVELRASFLYTVEDGLVTRGRVFATPEEALEAAGASA